VLAQTVLARLVKAWNGRQRLLFRDPQRAAGREDAQALDARTLWILGARIVPGHRSTAVADGVAESRVASDDRHANLLATDARALAPARACQPLDRTAAIGTNRLRRSAPARDAAVDRRECAVDRRRHHVPAARGEAPLPILIPGFGRGTVFSRELEIDGHIRDLANGAAVLDTRSADDFCGHRSRLGASPPRRLGRGH